ncbi:MAG: GEVED domain-containing protein, partial [Flavobacteriales bacterium]|nr:GEVED domain-containing protein [Flavobacteriales bacterium]
VTIKNIGSAPWTDGGGKVFNVGVKWNTNGTSWSDYHVRVSAKNLKPGATETYTFPITASANVNGTYGTPLSGANNLSFDVVYEGVAWFGNLPGNSVFTTPTQTISGPISTISANPVPADNSSKVCYAGLGAITNMSWGAVTGATSYDVYFGAGSLPGSVTSNVTSTSYTTGTLLPNTTYYWKIVPRNGCGITSGTPVTWSFTTTGAPCACAPTITNHNDLYMNSFQFVGTLNDNPSPNTSGASGYSDFTNLAPVVRQPQGAVLNIVANAVGSTGQPTSGFWKAWVDFNNNGVFESTEQVYSLTDFSTESLTFGFVIPASTNVGKYRFRIRVGNVTMFDACTNLTKGETEDYLFEVIADCPAKINTTGLKDVQRCGAGTLTLTATGTGTGVRWYADATGGSPLFDGANFTTPVIPENTRRIYYVAAYNGTCESVFRIPVTAIANPGPTVDFGIVPSFCAATTSGQVITASNGKRMDILLNETFGSGLGVFAQNATETGFLDRPETYWINRPSPYIPPMPPYQGLAPALSSGYTGGNFAMTNTDYDRSGKLLNRITTTNNLDTRNFDNLNLDFDLYYFTLITADTDPDLINYFSVDYSLNGTTWVNLQTINKNQGNPNIWEKISIALPAAVLGKTTLKIRFSSYSYGGTINGNKVFKESIAAIDNVKVYGIKDESSQFIWSSLVSGILYESNCTTPLNPATKAASICIKPTAAQLENHTEFSINATANFSNGCPANGTLIVKNDAKFYNTTTSTDWNIAANWKPDTVVPDETKCVIIKTPVFLSTGNGSAKNVTIEPGGTLTINKDRTLKVIDYIKNKTTVDNAKNLVVESDGNLIQINDNAVNTGSMTAKREV